MLNFDYLNDPALGYWLNGRVPSTATQFCNDSRRLLSGDCFLAIRTEQRDGNEFLSAAYKNGASCAFVNYPQPDIDIPQFVCKDTLATLNQLAKTIRKNYKYPVAAITGSMGKTSTKDLLSLFLDVKNNKTRSNENSAIGVPMTLCRLRPDEHHGVIEIGIDSPGDMIDRACLVKPTGGIITGVSSIHLVNFNTLDELADEKCTLAAFILAHQGLCIFPESLLRFKCFRGVQHACIVPSTDPAEKIWYSINRDSNPRELILSVNGTKYKVNIPHTMSEGMISNLVLSTVYALFANVSINDINKKLASWQPSELRGRVINMGDRVFYADCYNANPASFEDSLNNFDRLFPHGSRLFIIGCLSENEIGDTSMQENYKLGGYLPLRAGDTVLIIGDQADAIEQGIIDKRYDFQYTCIPNPKDLEERIKQFAGTVYIKGHVLYHLRRFII